MKAVLPELLPPMAEVASDCPADGSSWQVYIILCDDNSLYTGITTDVARRFRQHLAGRGAKYFRGRKPLQVVYQETGHSRSSAAGREALIKAMNRTDKVKLVSAGTDNAQFLRCQAIYL